MLVQGWISGSTSRMKGQATLGETNPAMARLSLDGQAVRFFSILRRIGEDECLFQLSDPQPAN